MAYHQNSSVNSNKLIIGNAKIETAASVGASYVNLGAGMVSAFAHTPTMYDVQAGNAPDPIEGVAEEVCTLDFELIEYDASVLSAISCGLVTQTATSVLSTLVAGGNATLTPRVFRITNTRMIGATTSETVLTIFKGTLTTGISINFKSDNDADPIALMPGQIEGKVDSTLSVGSQLYTLTRTLVS